MSNFKTVIRSQCISFNNGSDDEEPTIKNEGMFDINQLREVDEEKMKDTPHNAIAAILWLFDNKILKGTGFFVSANLVITSAHNILCVLNKKQIKAKQEQIRVYPGQAGLLSQGFTVDKIYIPPQYEANPRLSNYHHDYAFIKTKEKLEIHNFLKLYSSFNDYTQKPFVLKLYGYPGENHKIKTGQKHYHYQSGTEKEDNRLEISQNQRYIKHYLSTKIGHSGSPLILGSDYVIGIHKGMELQKSNICIRITEDFIAILRGEAVKMGAEPVMVADQVFHQITQIEKERKQQEMLQLLREQLQQERQRNQQLKREFQLQTGKYQLEIDRLISLIKKQKVLNIIHNLSFSYPTPNPEPDSKNLAFEKNKIKKKIFIEDYEFDQDLTESFQDVVTTDKQQKKPISQEQQEGSTQLLTAEVWFKRGEELQIKKQYNQAAECYRTAITKDNTHFQTYKQLGYCLSGLNKWQEAIENYRKAISLNKDDAHTYSWLGYALNQTKKHEEAIKYYHRAIQIEPNDSKAHNGLAYALKASKKIEEAIASYRRAIQLNPDYSKAYNGLGNALSDSNRIEEAIIQYRKAIKIDPHNSTAYNNLCITLYDSNRIEEAIIEYRNAIEIDPNNSAAYNGLGNALSDTNKTQEAIVYYRKALQLDPNNPVAYNNLAITLFNNKMIEDAIIEYRNALKIDPNYSAAYNGLGVALYRTSRIEQAMNCYLTAIQKDPNNYFPYNSLGIIYKNKGQYTQAIQHYLKALSIKPNHINCLFNIGLVYKQMTNREKARECFQKCLKIDKNFKEAEKQLQLL